MQVSPGNLLGRLLAFGSNTTSARRRPLDNERRCVKFKSLIYPTTPTTPPNVHLHGEREINECLSYLAGSGGEEGV